MKKEFKMPVISVKTFEMENVVTTSGGVDETNVTKMRGKMQEDGYKVSTFSLDSVF